jgi:hypothetical protein
MRATTSRRLRLLQASQGSSESRRTARFDLLTAPYATKSVKQLDRNVTAGRGLAQSPMTAICADRTFGEPKQLNVFRIAIGAEAISCA